MREKNIDLLKKKIRLGKVYRRGDLAPFSSSVDRHLRELVEEGFLKKMNNGLYLRPKQSPFGELPPADEVLLESFLKTSRFLAYSPNSFNTLGLGTTQLYNLPVVLNQKRHGEVKLGGRTFLFFRKMNVPNKMTRELLLVELLNNLKNVAEDSEQVLKNLRERLSNFDEKELKRAMKFGTYSTNKRLNELLESNLKYAI